MQEFLKQYKKVFDKDGNVLICGRTACINLIEKADKLEPDIAHGCVDTGVMNIDSLHNLYFKYFTSN